MYGQGGGRNPPNYNPNFGRSPPNYNPNFGYQQQPQNQPSRQQQPPTGASAYGYGQPPLGQRQQNGYGGGMGASRSPQGQMGHFQQQQQPARQAPTGQFQQQPARQAQTATHYEQQERFGYSQQQGMGMYHRSGHHAQQPQQQQQQGYGGYDGPGAPQQQQQQQRQSQQAQPEAAPAVNLADATKVAAAAAAMLSGDATAGANLVEKEGMKMVSRWMPGFSAFWQSLRAYFAVSHSYAAAKLRALLFPWTKRVWRRHKVAVAQAVPTSPPGPEQFAFALPSEDNNAPDLYIPLVAFLTFALVTGYVKGASGTFTPEVLAQIVTNCAMFQLFELGLYSAGLYASGATIPLLDIACHTGYKYVALCVNLVAGLFFGVKAYYGALAYTAAAASYYMLKTMAQTVPTKIRPGSPAPKREIVVLVLGGIQGLSVWFLGYNRL